MKKNQFLLLFSLLILSDILVVSIVKPNNTFSLSEGVTIQSDEFFLESLEKLTGRPFSSANSDRLIYSTLLGGSIYDKVQDIVVDDSGCAYITGETSSSNFPTTPGAINVTHNGAYDVFVCKINFDGTSLLYSTLLGGLDNDNGKSIAVDTFGCAYITGSTYSSDFPTTLGAINDTHNGGEDVFVCKISADGTTL